jgi:phosphate starvation-inducible PhoH-like protein
VEFAPAAKIDLEDNEVARAFCGERNVNLRLIERRLGVKIGQRGTELHFSGPPDALGLATKLVEQLVEAIKAGHSLFAADVERAIGAVARGELKFKEMVLNPLLIRAGNRQITPKSIAQKRYTEAIRADDIVFAIGPAGTGKTYLAMAMAVSFFQDRKVKRIVLTRPAVEAGEKLGFLPGDLAQKDDP